MAEPNLTLYWGSGSPYAWRVQLALELKRVPYVSRLLEFSKGDHRRPEFLALNPRHRVPVLVDGDLIVHESLAIVAYLDRRFPEPALLGTDATSTGAIWQRVMEHEHYLLPAASRATRPVFAGKGDAALVEEAMSEVHAELAILESALADAPWLAGERVTAVDVVTYPTVRTLLRAAGKPAAAELGFSLDLGRYPRVEAWRERLYGLPGVAGTDPPHWR